MNDDVVKKLQDLKQELLHDPDYVLPSEPKIQAESGLEHYEHFVVPISEVDNTSAIVAVEGFNQAMKLAIAKGIVSCEVVDDTTHRQGNTLVKLVSFLIKTKEDSTTVTYAVEVKLDEQYLDLAREKEKTDEGNIDALMKSLPFTTSGF